MSMIIKNKLWIHLVKQISNVTDLSKLKPKLVIKACYLRSTLLIFNFSLEDKEVYVLLNNTTTDLWSTEK